MKVWKCKEYLSYLDEELGKSLNKLQQDGATIVEILPIEFGRSNLLANPYYYGSYKVIYTMEDTENESLENK